MHASIKHLMRSVALCSVISCHGSTLSQPRTVTDRHAAAESGRIAVVPKPSAAVRPLPVGKPAPPEPATAEPDVFPDRTVDHHPRLVEWLDPTAPLSPYFSSTLALKNANAPASALIGETKTGLRSRGWTSQTRTGCLFDADGYVVVAARQLVLDADGRVRALTESSGTDDSAGESRAYYDASGRLRVYRVNWRNYMGSTADVVMSFSPTGHLDSCSHPPDSGQLFCEPLTPTDNGISQGVADVLRDDVSASKSRKPRPSWIQMLVDTDPRAQFERCDTPYVPGE